MVVVGAVVIEDTVQRFQQFEVVCGHRGNDEVQHAREELVRAQELVVVILEPVRCTGSQVGTGQSSFSNGLQN
jgi:hypothetical protein